MITITAPNGGEAWQRGLNFFVQWNGNTPEPVAIDLYKGGVFLKTLATNANTGAYRWSIGFNLLTGRDYSIAVRSTTTGALSDTSDLPFSLIDAPAINAGSVSRLPDGSAQFGYTAPGAGTNDCAGLDESDHLGGAADAAADERYRRFYQSSHARCSQSVLPATRAVKAFKPDRTRQFSPLSSRLLKYG